MIGVSFTTPTNTSPYFLGEVLGDHNIMPFHAKLVASAFSAGSDGRRYVPAGTLVGRTFVERAAGTGFGAPDVSTPDDELYLTAHDVVDANLNNDVSLIRHNTIIKENFLPGWSGLSTGAKGAIRSLYQTTSGV